jgi:hypothetical protein
VNKKFVIAWVAVFIAWMIGSFIVHAQLLHADYLALGPLFRQEADQGAFLPIMLVAHVIMAGAFAWIYARGVEAKPWVTQGLRYGLAVALLAIVPTYLIYYCVQPLPLILVEKQIAFDGTLLLVLGVVVAWVYRGNSPAT